jgi:hypothetical protein
LLSVHFVSFLITLPAAPHAVAGGVPYVALLQAGYRTSHIAHCKPRATGLRFERHTLSWPHSGVLRHSIAGRNTPWRR